ncbi:MAG: STAS domain-containing protein [Ignavibacteriaceae bacterium]|nr:STAS domain-containing protein [Ignavibacteriaceae bacterium]
MKFKVSEKYNAAIVEVKGNMMGGPEAIEFSDQLKKLLAEGKKNIVIDLSDVKFMNSSGLGMLISGLTTVRNGGGLLKLANVTDKIQSLLMITKLITIFETFESIDDAVKSFGI